MKRATCAACYCELGAETIKVNLGNTFQSLDRQTKFKATIEQIVMKHCSQAISKLRSQYSPCGKNSEI